MLNVAETVIACAMFAARLLYVVYMFHVILHVIVLILTLSNSYLIYYHLAILCEDSVTDVFYARMKIRFKSNNLMLDIFELF